MDHAVCAQLLQLCPALCDPMDCSLPGSLSLGILQARILEWLPCPPPGNLPDSETEPESLISSALAGRSLPLAPPGKSLTEPILVQSLNHVRLFATPWTAASQAPVFRLPCPSLSPGVCSNSCPEPSTNQFNIMSLMSMGHLTC